MMTAVILLLAVPVSCVKENAQEGRGARLVPEVAISGSHIVSGTRAAYSGTTFTKDKTLGLSICVHEEGMPAVFEPFLTGYGNIKATSTDDTGDSWTFYSNAIGVSLSELYLTSRQDRTRADIYAYAPYMDGVSDITAIPVDFSQNQDVMYAVQNGVSNRDIDPEVNAEIPVPLTFRHLLCRLRFGFKLEYAGSNHLMDYITIKKTGAGTTPLYSQGTFNALTGSISAGQADSVRVKFKGTNTSDHEHYGLFSNAGGYTYFDFLLYPTDFAADGDLTVIFTIDDFRHEYVIRREDIKHSDGVTYGFQPGCSYDFQFQLDNYVHLKGITIQSSWTPDVLEDVL